MRVGHLANYAGSRYTCALLKHSNEPFGVVISVVAGISIRSERFLGNIKHFRALSIDIVLQFLFLFFLNFVSKLFQLFNRSQQQIDFRHIFTQLTFFMLLIRYILFIWCAFIFEKWVK